MSRNERISRRDQYELQNNISPSSSSSSSTTKPRRSPRNDINGTSNNNKNSSNQNNHNNYHNNGANGASTHGPGESRSNNDTGSIDGITTSHNQQNDQHQNQHNHYQRRISDINNNTKDRDSITSKYRDAADNRRIRERDPLRRSTAATESGAGNGHNDNVNGRSKKGLVIDKNEEELQKMDNQRRRNRRRSSGGYEDQRGNDNGGVSNDRENTPRRKQFQESNDYRKRNSFSGINDNSHEQQKRLDADDDDDVILPDNDNSITDSREVSNEEIKIDNDEDDQMAMMQQLMGFGGFGTTKGKHVAGTDVYVASKPKAGSFRQYMNRLKGFNRPLSPPPSERKKSSRGA